MKKRSFISSVLALSLCASSLLMTGASAAVAGDVDGNGSLTAADARLALRASVGLENLDEAQTRLADVDGTKGITAADARLILRASVGLETLPEPEPEYILFNGHKVDSASIGIEKGITCIDPESELNGQELMPSFNTLVNSLKTPGSTNYFYGFSRTVTDTPKPECKANGVMHLALAEIMEGLLADSVIPGKITEYNDMTMHRHVNNATFFVMGTPFVSDLSEEDVKSITMEKMTGVDFVKELPDKFTSTENEEYDLTPVKASEIGEVYKVTVALNPETVTQDSVPDTTTPIEKILNKDYNSGISQQMASLNGAFNEMPEMAGMFVMEMTITTTGVITYYFTADTFEPVAARYNIEMKTDSFMHTYFNGLFKKTDKATTTTTIANNTIQDNFFFFNDFFTFE